MSDTSITQLCIERHRTGAVLPQHGCFTALVFTRTGSEPVAESVARRQIALDLHQCTVLISLSRRMYAHARSPLQRACERKAHACVRFFLAQDAKRGKTQETEPSQGKALARRKDADGWTVAMRLMRVRETD